VTAHGVSDGELRRRYGQVFDGVAEEYDRERPSYPTELIEAAMKRGGLSAGDPVVEVGCGTGLLTAALVAAGLRVEAVDPGENMIRLARRRVGDGAPVRFHHGRFEDVALPQGAFAAVFSATAFHWVEPEVGWARAAGLLRPSGVLALLQYSEVADERTDEDRQALHAALGKVAPDIAAGWPGIRSADAIRSGAAERRGNISEVWAWMGRHDLAVAEAAALFTDVQLDTMPVYTELTADRLNGYLRTTSLYARLGPGQRAQLQAENRLVAERAGGVARFSELAVLVTGVRAPEAASRSLP
jgi:ubiquinone/menaquinone biosynthesis C-methylase UbiE